MEEVLASVTAERASVESGYVTPQQVCQLLNAEDRETALADPSYILILDRRSAERWKLLSTYKATNVSALTQFLNPNLPRGKELRSSLIFLL